MNDPPSHLAERRLAAVWFADIVGFSTLASRDEKAALVLVNRFETITRRAVEHYRGRVVKFIGDAALAEFGSVEAAVRAALTLRDSFAGPVADGPSATLRIGVHLGEVTSRKDGDLSGNGVNVAARLQTEAAPGQVLVSEDVWRQLRPLSDFHFEAAGERELKGIHTRVAAFGAGLAGDAPGPRLEDLKTGIGRSTPVMRRPSRWVLAAIGSGFLALLLGVLVATGHLAGTRTDSAAEASGAVPQPAVLERSVAVLPFANLSTTRENEYFSDGITEDILTNLSKSADLKVISRTSAMHYKGTQKPLRQIAQELGVAHVLEGSVRREGDRVRITAQLINARTDEPLWAETYDRQVRDVFAVQSEIAQKIASALQTRLSADEQMRMQNRHTGNLVAYDLYLRGRHFWSQDTPEGLRRAIDFFQRAIAQDSGYALAYAGIADSYARLDDNGALPSSEARPRALQAARKAITLKSTVAEAHASLAHILMHQMEWEPAEREYRRALELNPNYATARLWYAVHLMARGHVDAAIREAHRARSLDPLSVTTNVTAGSILAGMGQYEEARQILQSTLELAQEHEGAHLWLAVTDVETGRFEEGIRAFEKLGDRAYVARAMALSGRPQEALQVLRQMEQSGSQPPPTTGYHLALAYAALGESERALDWLETIPRGTRWFLLFKTDRRLDPLRSDPRFVRLLRSADLA